MKNPFKGKNMEIIKNAKIKKLDNKKSQI